ncbi:hypothetical protein CJU90_3823 [Yarrowia sp. C11]|nr:hypothetical protein CKK34_5434 [Yarrowia sp. E02]KAG5367525.1 hypothetical protein CJU90_3823 [Yarrowia sp. C11]
MVCEKGEEIRVHTQILAALWPYFAKMMSNDKEKTERIMRIDYPKDWVARLILSIYKQQVAVISFDEATGLLILADVYLLPDSSEEAIHHIKQLVDEETSSEDLLLGWKRSREARNDEMKRFFASTIAKRDPLSQPELFEGWDKDMCVELYLDTLATITRE